MSEQAWYKDWFNSPFYHKLYFERDEKEANAFISKLIDHLRPAPKCYMLDVACGRGRHSRLLANKAFIVTGIDLSSDSIVYAKKFEQENLEFYQHDMRLPFRVNYYDYAFNFFTSFGYFKTRREHDDAVRTISNSLKPKGIFVIDYLNVHYAEEHFVNNEIKVIDKTTYEIHRWHDETHFYKKIIIHDPLLLHPIDYTEKVSKFSFGDFNDMLSYQGLQVQEVFGDFHLNSYDVRTKPRLIVIAKKIHQ
jgi:SAM-dependent methyltransferase